MRICVRETSFKRQLAAFPIMAGVALIELLTPAGGQ
jgi:hypothetical protein